MKQDNNIQTSKPIAMKRKKPDDPNNTSDDDGSIHKLMMEEVAALAGAARPQKRFVGIRQRPSGRWVAEIKDTVQKIRVWLGTYNTAEEAARAYDEAACLLRGANTRTNFLSGPTQGRPTPTLPPKTANRLLQRLKARSVDLLASESLHCAPNDGVAAPNLTTEAVANVSNKDKINYGSHSSIGNDIVLAANSTYTVANPTDKTTEMETRNNVGCCLTATIDFGQLVDGPDYSSSSSGGFGSVDLSMTTTTRPGYCSALDIAHEMTMDPFLKQSKEEDDNDRSDHDCEAIEGMSEMSKRLSYERKFSASLYAYNGVAECLSRMVGVNSTNNDDISSDSYNYDCPQMSSACSSLSSFNGGEDEELSLWSSLDFPSQYFSI